MALRQKQHVCHACGGVTGDTNGGFRFCGDACEEQHAADHEELRQRLSQEGFVQSAEAPNVWLKDDVALIEEAVYLRGIDKALSQHAQVTANPSVPAIPTKRNKWQAR